MSVRFMLQVFWIAGALVLGIPLIVFLLGYIISSPPFPPANTREVENALRSAHERKLSTITSADEYCILGMGINPYIFAEKNFPNYTLDGQEDKLFMRSSSHWHLVLINKADRTYQALPIHIAKIDLADENASPKCSRVLNQFKHCAEVWH